MLHRLANLLGSHRQLPLEGYDAGHVDRRLVGRHLQHIGLMVEVAVVLRIDEGQATTGILAVLQRLDVADAATMASQAAYGKRAAGEHLVEFITEELSVEDDLVLDAIFLNQFVEAWGMLVIMHLRVPHAANDVEVNFGH